MSYFENEIAKAVILAVFVPLIISSGGNSGSQATTLVIRAMALGQIRLGDWWRVLRREMIVGCCLGAIIGVIGLCRILGWAGLFSFLWRSLSTDRRHGWFQPDWYRRLGQYCRRDVAFYLETRRL